MPFPTNPPKQMPCPHWNHFPINPAVQAFGAVSGGGSPPVIDSYKYCRQCASSGEQAKK